MNAKLLFFQVILAVMGLCGCAFEPEGEFFAIITPPEAITVTFELNDPVFNNPYYLLEPTNFHIKLQDTTFPLIGSEVAVSGSVVSSRVENNRDLFFLLDPSQHRIGNHSVSVRCFLNTKSGSLASIVGAENYVVDQTFEIRIDPTPPVFEAFQADVENGFLTFKWNNKTNRQNYVYKIKRQSGYYLYSPDTLVNEPQMRQFIDRGYIGGHLYYQITAKGFGFEKVVGEGSFYHEAADFTAKRTADGQAILSWTNRYFSGENLEMAVRASGIFEGERRLPFTSSGEIMLGHSPIGEHLTVVIDFYRRDFFNRKNYGVAIYDVEPTLFPFTFFALLSKSKKLIVGNSKMLLRYRLEDRIQLEDSIFFADLGFTGINEELVMSPDESKAFISGFGSGGKLISFDPQNFSVLQHHDLNSILKAFDLPIAHTSMSLGNVSNNGLLTFVAGKESLYTVLVDLPHNKVIWHSPPNNYRHPIVSPDGKFLAATFRISFNEYEGWVFAIKDGKTERIGRMDGGYPVFLRSGTEIMSSLHGGIPYNSPGSRLSVFDLNNPPSSSDEYLPLLRSDPIPNLNGLESAFYDPISNYIAFSYSNETRLYNVSTMRFEKTYMGRKLFYADNYLISGRGFIELAP